MKLYDKDNNECNCESDQVDQLVEAGWSKTPQEKSSEPPKAPSKSAEPPK